MTAGSTGIAISVIGNVLKKAAIAFTAPKLVVAGLAVGVVCGAIWLKVGNDDAPTYREMADVKEILMSTGFKPTGDVAKMADVAYFAVHKELPDDEYFRDIDEIDSFDELDLFPTTVEGLEMLRDVDVDVSTSKRKSSGTRSGTRYSSESEYGDVSDDGDDDFIADANLDETPQERRERMMRAKYGDPAKRTHPVMEQLKKNARSVTKGPDVTPKLRKGTEEFMSQKDLESASWINNLG